ncbi:hypothetical protein M3Y96_00528900 [Aphelenchoides besseyi]|nr:hypothetical protein M3Y96_00528900 [Aphelenchoides besseyi]
MAISLPKSLLCTRGYKSKEKLAVINRRRAQFAKTGPFKAALFCEAKLGKEEFKRARTASNLAIQMDRKLEDAMKHRNLSTERNELAAQLKNQEAKAISSDLKALLQFQKENKPEDFCLKVNKPGFALKSKFFAKKLEKNAKKNDYLLTDTTFEVVKTKVEFIYLGQTNAFDEKSDELYRLCVCLGIRDLRKTFMDKMKSLMSTKNVPKLLVMTVSYKDKQLSQLATEFAEQNNGKEKFAFSGEVFELFEEMANCSAML